MRWQYDVRICLPSQTKYHQMLLQVGSIGQSQRDRASFLTDNMSLSALSSLVVAQTLSAEFQFFQSVLEDLVKWNLLDGQVLQKFKREVHYSTEKSGKLDWNCIWKTEVTYEQFLQQLVNLLCAACEDETRRGEVIGQHLDNALAVLSLRTNRWIFHPDMDKGQFCVISQWQQVVRALRNLKENGARVFNQVNTNKNSSDIKLLADVLSLC